MMIHSHLKDYEVTLTQQLPKASSLADPAGSFYVVDRKVYELYPALFDDLPEERLMVLTAIEQNKTIDTALAICERMTGMNAKRNAVLVSYGGGIVQDLTGFAANILYRGVRWVWVPTTLLAACDSCIGSKTSLNYKQYKNLLGTFYPPDRILICPLFFNTLSETDYNSGLGEVVKFNVMTGEQGIADLERELPLLQARDAQTVNRFVERSLHFKQPFIEEDEFDRGRRILLNFAHTFGHAIEVSSGYHIPHGSAVAMGMLMANRVSLCRGWLSDSTAARIEELVRQILRLEIRPEWFDAAVMEQAIRKDKKQVDDGLTAILPDSAYQLCVVKDLTTEELADALIYLKGFLGLA